MTQGIYLATCNKCGERVMIPIPKALDGVYLCPSVKKIKINRKG